MTRFVDTNFLVRIITRDVASLAQEAIAAVEAAQRDELVVLDAVLVELFFILEANQQYRYSREASVLAFESLVTLPQFKVSEHARAAFEIYKRHKKLDFTDCLLIVAAGNKRRAIVSFDKDLLKATSS